MLYSKIEENQSLVRRSEEQKSKHTMFLMKLVLQLDHKNSPTGDGLKELLKSSLNANLKSMWVARVSEPVNNNPLTLASFIRINLGWTHFK